jgi:hypothetical protein
VYTLEITLWIFTRIPDEKTHTNIVWNVKNSFKKTFVSLFLDIFFILFRHGLIKLRLKNHHTPDLDRPPMRIELLRTTLMTALASHVFSVSWMSKKLGTFNRYRLFHWEFISSIRQFWLLFFFNRLSTEMFKQSMMLISLIISYRVHIDLIS